MSTTQHEQHESTRRAAEVVVRGRGHKRREHRLRGGCLPDRHEYVKGLRAVGVLAYASIYTLNDEFKHPAPRKPDFLVERRLARAVAVEGGGSTEWVTAGRSEQCKTLEQARRYVRGRVNYRVVVLNVRGNYDPI